MAARDRLSRLARYTAAAVVGVLALATSADAVISTTTPNAAYYTYNLAAGAATANYAPPYNVPVNIMANCTTTGVRGVGQVTLNRFGPDAVFLQWVGINSEPDGTVTHGYSSIEGTHILRVNYNGDVWLEVGTSGGPNSNNRDTLRIDNESTGTRAGAMTWIW